MKKLLLVLLVGLLLTSPAFAVKTLIVNNTFCDATTEWSGGVLNSSMCRYEIKSNFSTLTSGNRNLSKYIWWNHTFVGTLNNTVNYKLREIEESGGTVNPHLLVDMSGSNQQFRPEPGYSPSYTQARGRYTISIIVNLSKNNITLYVDGVYRWSYNGTAFSNGTTYNFTRIEGGVLNNGTIWFTNETLVADDGTAADTTAPSILFVRNNSITNASAIIESNASESSNMSVKYGTTTSLGSQSDNSTSATNVSVGLTGLQKLTLYYYNVTRCDSSGNCNTSGPRNFTTLDNPVVNTTTWVVNITGISDYGNHSIELVWANSTTGETATNTTTLTFRVDSPVVVPTANATRCPSILSLVWNANISRGSYDPKTKTYNESGILPVNNSLCGWTYMLNNSNASTVVFNFSTNHTDASGNYTMWVNGTMINASSTKLISVPSGAVYYVNVSVNLTRWPVLRSEPSINFTVRT